MSELITRNGGPMSSANFMRLLKTALNDGIIDGCAITKSGANITVAAGHIMACGGLIEVSATTLTVSSSGEIVLRIDTNAETQASVLARTATTLTQNDLTNGGTVYELQLATYTFSSGAVGAVTTKLGTSKPKEAHRIFVQDTEPTGVQEGDLWFK